MAAHAQVRTELQEIVVPATDFAREFPKFRDEATANGIVKVTSYGRTVGAYISAIELEHFQALKRRERKVFVAGEIPNDVIEEIKNAEYGS